MTCCPVALPRLGRFGKLRKDAGIMQATCLTQLRYEMLQTEGQIDGRLCASLCPATDFHLSMISEEMHQPDSSRLQFPRSWGRLQT